MLHNDNFNSSDEGSDDELKYTSSPYFTISVLFNYSISDPWLAQHTLIQK